MRSVVLLIGFGALSPAALAHVDEAFCPLEEGIEWVMDMKITKPTGESRDFVCRMKIGPKQIQDGTTYYKFTGFRDGREAPLNEYLLRRDDTGYYCLQTGAEELTLKFPIIAENRWPATAGTVGETAVIGAEDITVNTVLYKGCWHTLTKNEAGTINRWYAHNIGLVRMEAMQFGGVLTFNLREFKPGKK